VAMRSRPRKDDNQGVERTDTVGILKDTVVGKYALNPMGGAGDKTGG
jgi:hypothetical protein